MLLMTGHPGLVPGMPRFLKARLFVKRSAVVVSMTSVIKTVHVRAFALCEQVEWLFGTDSVLDGLVTARVDLERR